jgi:type IV secretory pathway VirJ component
VTGNSSRTFTGALLATGLLLASGEVATAPTALRDLPITEVPATGQGPDVFAVMISGDGGWARLDKGLSAELARRGIPVAGLDSLHYFWRARTPDETAADIDRIIDHYATHWHRQHVLLIGYSFGADVMPAVFNRLAPPSRERVTSLSLLGLAQRSRYEVGLPDWIPGLGKKGPLVEPEIGRINAVPILCVTGEGERKSICPQLRQPGIAVREIGRTHHFSYLDSEIADAILSAAHLET